MVKQISDNEIYLLIKYIKSVLWRAAKRLSYIEDARCLQVKCLGRIFRVQQEHIVRRPVARSASVTSRDARSSGVRRRVRCSVHSASRQCSSLVLGFEKFKKIGSPAPYSGLKRTV